ncbi:thioredoxin-dependent thiol peroxidase [Gryllotalpicola sp.]|uniref:thioredoxin-dependent thiol peroxidase n=1 Tax=Gryllotalpicola sp. TaxID=1932787 RepID=UPI00261237BF|nr:thioredoxin-dependent thiol peroxidase [Gryllotalpicola sp.]
MPDTAPDHLLHVGDRAPVFTLPDEHSLPISLLDFRGTKTIVYFYPRAMTPGCTTQACDFRDSLGPLQTAGYLVVGISKDSPERLARFAERDHLTFPLLSDSDLAVHRRYGVWGEKKLYGKVVTGVRRSTFVLDENGILTHTFYNTKATGHVAMLRNRLGV